MWPRVVEIMLGCWLLASPFIFRHSADQRVFWCTDLIAGLLVIAISCAAFWEPLRYIHLSNVLLALWLLGFSYFTGEPPPEPARQNEFVVGLLLLMLAIIPAEAAFPPLPWRHRVKPGAEQR
ncbi:MAG: SPW repeat domain-containing protein, partial [Bryobacteraceae bacterium]